ncbi:hypothetical protein GCM10007424_23500 [Flavobacterium suaedae]|uniref:Transmembrane protein n=1 Tax=Flavobacterium suaedae TaxID=1767027 RepID=A0ABQ1JYX3_9FLAO|nr:hypothetical protein [Flavobacterium suaedae]GGB82759.1 hypothetical protein GCM10007424_23500 [Flavobacterium suaedae]
MTTDITTITAVVLIIAAFVIFLVLGIFIGVILHRNKDVEDPTLKGYPKCRCTDGTHCDLWCIAKEVFKRNS